MKTFIIDPFTLLFQKRSSLSGASAWDVWFLSFALRIAGPQRVLQGRVFGLHEGQRAGGPGGPRGAARRGGGRERLRPRGGHGLAPRGSDGAAGDVALPAPWRVCFSSFSFFCFICFLCLFFRLGPFPPLLFFLLRLGAVCELYGDTLVRITWHCFCWRPTKAQPASRCQQAGLGRTHCTARSSQHRLQQPGAGVG